LQTSVDVMGRVRLEITGLDSGLALGLGLGLAFWLGIALGTGNV